MVDIRYPLLFQRRVLPKIWGARRLETLFGMELPPSQAIGESWELSDHPSGESVVANGPLTGRSLRDLMSSSSRDILGAATPARGGRFPLLVKFVDTADRLSVQVHPDDAAAARMGESDGGKNESWYVVHADPGAVLWVGLTEGKARGDLENANTNGAFESCLHALTPAVGESIAIPAGTIHAIGAGFTLCEIQQTSDVTYRVYDWGRPATASRLLHREQSFAVARFGARSELTRAPLCREGDGLFAGELPSPGSFRWKQCQGKGAFSFSESGHFRIVVLIAGSLELASAADPAQRVAVKPGQAALVPAAAGAISGRGDRAEFLLIDPQ